MKERRVINGESDLYALVQILPRVPVGHVVTIHPPTRDEVHNAALHALLTPISKNLPWAGKLRSVEVWKRLMTAAWLRAKGENVEVLPALDGHGIDIVYTPTSSLSNEEQNDLMSYIEAMAAQLGYVIPERKEKRAP